jgi:hypothetical protein
MTAAGAGARAGGAPGPTRAHVTVGGCGTAQSYIELCGRCGDCMCAAGVRRGVRRECGPGCARRQCARACARGLHARMCCSGERSVQLQFHLVSRGLVREQRPWLYTTWVASLAAQWEGRCALCKGWQSGSGHFAWSCWSSGTRCGAGQAAGGASDVKGQPWCAVGVLRVQHVIGEHL